MLARSYMLCPRRRVLLVCILVPPVLLGLAWVDVLPGGWRLRGWVTPHAVRQAREQAARSEERLERFAEENASAPAGATVWLGSSTIERFPLQELLPGLEHLNRGIGNESAGGLLARLERSLPAARPARLIFYIGSIDFRAQARAPASIAAAADTIMREALTTYGEGAPIQVLLLGILPERRMPAGMAERLTATNLALAATCAEDPGRSFLDPNREPLRLPGGDLNPAFAADRLHLNRPGYVLLAEWLREGNLLPR